MKKSIKILYILLLVCTIMLPFGVRAVVGSDSAIGSNNGTSCGNKCPTGDSTKVYIPIDSTTGKLPTKAIRVTLMDGNGNRINSVSSKNFAADTLWNDSNIKSYGAYISNGNSRVQIVNGATPSWKQVDVNKLDNYFTKDTNISNALKNDGGLSYASIADYFDTMANSADSVSSFLSTYFGVGDFKTNTSASNWFLLIEPLVPVRKDYKALVFGTPSEFSKHGDPAPILTNYNLDHFSRYNYLYITKTNFSDNGLSASFNALSAGNGSTTMVGTGKNGNGAGLVWIGKSATPPSKPCSDYKDRNKDIWVAGWKYDPDKANNKVDNNANPDTIRSTCGKAPKSCSEFANDTNIWSGAWVYDSSKANTKVEADAKNDKVRQSCGRNVCSEDAYNKNNQLNKVKTTGNKTVNCCNQYPGKDQTRIYRDHPECYSCIYDPKKINATCEEGKNTSSVGDSFKSTNGYVLDNQTCIYKIASGGVKNASKDLVTRRRVSSSDSVCKVVCTENVEVKFPLLSSSLYRKGSYIEWPINTKFNEINSNSMLNSSRLTLNGSTKCWYYVNRVEFYKMTREAANTALKKCITDVYETFTGSKKIINYNLSGEFSVNYNDREYGKSELSLSETGSSEPKIEARSSEGTTLSKLNEWKNKSDVYNLFDDFVKIAEGITYTVTQSKDYALDYKNGYMSSYQGKYYTYSDYVKNKVSAWGKNSYIDIGKGILPLSSKKYSDGKVYINYKNIGGGSLKYSNTTNTYSGTTKNNVCSYKTIENDVISCECPSDTENAGEILDLKMITESLTCDEAVRKYCDSNPDNPRNMTVCPEDSPIEKRNRPVEKSCLNNDACKKLTCYNITCKKSDGNYVYLNLDIQKEMDKNSGISYDDAYKKAYEKNGCGAKPKYNEPGNIEYRVIDLKDPFPGNKAESGFPLFNSTIKGRKPGSNWNSTTIVKKEILNNRGVKGDEVYNLTPLYEFNLTPSVIKEIRNYNDNHSYDDFTLSCKGNNKQACVATDSGFNFKKKYGVVAVNSNCSSINDLNSFNRCYNS